MTNIICEFCNKTYSSKSSLNNHQKTTKKCLEIQGKISKNNDNKLLKFNCKYCNKNLTSKQNVKIHEISCSFKKDYEIKEIQNNFENEIKEIKNNHKNEIKEIKNNVENEIKEIQNNFENEIKEIKNKFENKSFELKLLKKKYKELEIENKKYLEEIQNIREINAELKGELKSTNKAADCIYEIAKQPKNITNTNNSKNLNISSSIDFNDIDKIKEIIDTKYNINHFLSGQKGFAHFAVQNLLKDEEGNYNYTCTDPSRQIFKFKNTKGEIEKDIEAKKLTNYLVEGGIKDKALDISLTWCQNEGKIDKEKFVVISEKQDSILNIQENNSEFKKELVSLVTQK